MRKKRVIKDKVEPILEGVYDFYEQIDQTAKKATTDKIIDYYIDKIVKYGQNSLTEKEKKIFDDAKKGKLSLEKPVYKMNKVTGDQEYDNLGNPIRIDEEQLIPGVPFVTSKGKGGAKKEIINGRCYWDVDEEFKTFYVYGGEVTDTNPKGLVVWKTVSAKGNAYGAFVVPKGEATLDPNDLWKNLNAKYDKGIILDKETYLRFLAFDDLYHKSRKDNAAQITELYDKLKIYPKK